MPGVWHPFAIETNDQQTAMLLLAWEMTKLNIFQLPEHPTGDEVRELFEKNYQAIRLAQATQYKA